MLTEYVQNKMERAKYKIIEDGTYFGAIPELRGVWANSKTLEGCRKELREVLEEWLLLKISSREKVTGLRWETDRRKLPLKTLLPTTVDHVFGCLKYKARPKTLAEMDEAIAKGLREQHGRGRY